MRSDRHRDYEALRGRILLVFQDHLMMCGTPGCWHLNASVAHVARELNVSRQAVYRAFPELSKGYGVVS